MTAGHKARAEQLRYITFKDLYIHIVNTEHTCFKTLGNC